ncbi:MAG: ABC transporter ATP-binding protein [Pseudomonadales bacterium]|nr:ABC transporter ATP-binding protein [Pseudomonadales bacterium]
MGQLTVNSLGKAYKIYPSPGARLREWILPFAGPRHQEKWVLKDISFSVLPGETVALVGANGAGKSTLLKLICGTVKPSLGSMEIQGHIAALLELGMGFHPEFTGRQNVFMAGQLLGLHPSEIAQLMPVIEDFAEIGEAIDQPVRTYSSGMQMRLAFSVATAKRPDLLIIDEALSVGDAYFQHKSFDRIRQFKKLGSTLIIVSHDRTAIQSICDRAILLDKGKMIMEGEPEKVMDYYNALMSERESMVIKQIQLDSGQVQTISGTGEASIESIELLNSEDKVTDVIKVGEKTTIQVKAKINQAIPQLVLGFMIKDRFGQPVYGINTYRQQQTLSDLTPGQTANFQFEFNMNIGAANYSIAFSLSKGDSHLEKNYEWRDYGAVFHVINVGKEDFVGSAWLNAQTEIELEQGQ